MKKENDEKETDWKLYIAMGGAVVLFIAAIFLFFNNNPGADVNGEYDDFARCIVEQEARFYGAATCGYCTQQKQAFGASFKILEEGGVYVECPQNAQLCIAEGIQGYPTWRFKTGTELLGFIPLGRLAEETGCEIIEGLPSNPT